MEVIVLLLSSISDKRISSTKRAPYIPWRPDADRPFRLESPRPTYVGALEAEVEDEQLSSLVDGGARLSQCARGVASLDDDRSFSQRAHCHVPLGEEQAVLRGCLPPIAQQRHLRDQQVVFRDCLL